MRYVRVVAADCVLALVIAASASSHRLESRAAAFAPPRAGLYFASGHGSQIVLAVIGHSVRIAYGTFFRYACAGPSTKRRWKKSPEILEFDFHPSRVAISARGAFVFNLRGAKLNGRFTSPTTARGSFRLRDGASSECHGDHSWTATLIGKPPGTITP